MSKVKDFISNAVIIAEDNSHGYDQAHRWGPDYDCSSFLITAADPVFHVKQYGATYTGNMLEAFKKAGFKDIKVNTGNVNELKAGDVLLNPGQHTALYIGAGKIVEASINEKGTITGGKTGDQTGKEIHAHSYYNKPWQHVLRYPETVDLEAVARDVIAGRYGNGEERKNRLRDAGFDPSEVQAVVNRIYNSPNITQVARDVIAGKYGNGEDRKNRLKAAGYDYATIQAEVNRLLR